MNEYHIGEDVICEGKFRNPANRQLWDPTAVFAKVKDPANNVTNHTYPSAELVKTAVGVYQVTVSPTLAGDWSYKLYSTGTGKGADEDTFRVLPSAFP